MTSNQAKPTSLVDAPESQLRQLLQREQLFSTITQRIRRSLKLEQVLNTAVEEVRQLLQTDRVVLYQFTNLDWAGEIAVESVNENALPLVGMNIEDNCFRQTHAHLYCDGRVRAIEDIHTADLAPCHRDLLASLQVRANLVVPVLHHDELWGLLIAHHCRSPRRWQDWEVELLKQLSTVIAIAIQQARLFDQLQTELAQREAISADLQISRERLRTIVSNALIALLAIDYSGEITLSTGTILDRLGRSETELVGQSAFEVYAHIPTFVEALRSALSGQAFTHSIEHQGFVFELRYSPKLDADQSLIGVICVATDVTEQRQAEEALRQSEILRRSEEKNRVLLNAIPDEIFRIHRDGTCLDFKPSTATEATTLIDTIVGKRLEDIFPPVVAQQFTVFLKRTLDTNQAQVFDYHLQADTPIDYEARVVVNGADEVLVIVRDISARKKVERLKNEFVSMVSHELRTPLTSIRGSLGLIIGGIAGELPIEAQELVNIAHKNTERLILLINDILDIEKIESGKMSFALRPVKLMPLVEQAIVANQAYAEQFNVTLKLTATLPDVEVNVDSQRLIQVLTNLLSNAAKFSPPGETVAVSVTARNQRIRISVKDRGSGIPQAFRDRIFQKFAQADSSDTRQKGGTGLGLSIAKAIIERLDGQIGFETELNVGTTFYCDLPQWSPPFCERPESQGFKSPSITVAPSAARILVCEDDPDIAMLLKLMLQQAGFQIDVACNAEKAKELLETNSYQVMTLDLALPGQDGISLIRELQLQEQTRLLSIVVVSAKAQQGRAELGEAGFAVVDWLDKPINKDRLVNVCQQITVQRNGKPKVLHIEDNPDITQVVGIMLKQDAEIHYASTLEQARQKLEADSFDLVILDITLPDGSGLELLPLVNREGMAIPVVLFSAREISLEMAQKVTTSLTKSRTSNQELLNAIRSLVGQS